MLVPEKLAEPLRWTRPSMVFVNSMSDLFHEDVPFQFIADVFAVMACTTRHTYQVLTKRPARMLRFFSWLNEERDGFGHPIRVDSLRMWPQWVPANGKRAGYDNCGPAWPLENVWLGVTVENQAAADERIPLLMRSPAAVRWVSMEPLLGDVNLSRWLDIIQYEDDAPWGRRNIGHLHDMLDWVVVGGESGHNARPMHPDWPRKLRDQCAAAGVPFLFKQWGEWAPHQARAGGDERGDLRRGRVRYIQGTEREPDGRFIKGDAAVARVGKKAAGRLLDGVQHDGYPIETP